MHPRIFRNHIRNQKKKLNQMSKKSQYQNFFLGMVYTLLVMHKYDKLIEMSFLMTISLSFKKDFSTDFTLDSDTISGYLEQYSRFNWMVPSVRHKVISIRK